MKVYLVMSYEPVDDASAQPYAAYTSEEKAREFMAKIKASEMKRLKKDHTWLATKFYLCTMTVKE
jgi:hypothetical protein